MLTRSIFVIAVLNAVAQTGGAQPLNTLVLKGTHNSYACCGGANFFGVWDNTCPVMHNPPAEQMNDWNVWALELDFSTRVQNGVPTLIVGHDGPTGDATYSTPGWGSTLRDYLVGIRNARAFGYRPAIIYFNHKTWGDNTYDPPTAYGPLLETLLADVFGTAAVFGPGAFAANGMQWPSAAALAGKVIPYTDGYAGDLLFSDNPPLLNRWYKDDYTDAGEHAQRATSGAYNLIGIDQYQEDWTFDHVAPPNPMYVKNDAPPSTEVINTVGHDCTVPRWPFPPDITNVGNPFVVVQHGTFRFPYDQIG